MQKGVALRGIYLFTFFRLPEKFRMPVVGEVAAVAENAVRFRRRHFGNLFVRKRFR